MKNVFRKSLLGCTVAALAALSAWFACRARQAAAGAAPAAAGETVVLLHGLNRTPRAMARLEEALREEGYVVINAGYPSCSAEIATLSSNLFASLGPRLAPAVRVHFVAHSIGGILLRHHLQTQALPNLGRVVMLGPPNGGSEVVDRLGGLAVFGWINGPAGRQLGTGAGSVPNRLAPPAFELGVIAGRRSVNPLLSLLIAGRDDGKVAVARTRVAGMSDFVCLPVTHTFMAGNSQVIRQTCHFLRTGRFQNQPEAAPGGRLPRIRNTERRREK